MTEDRRSTVRWRYVNAVVFTAKTASGEGQLANVSETGLFVGAASCPAVGETVQILLRGSTPTLMLKGEVRWIGRPRNGPQGFGVQLTDSPPAYVELVRSLALTQRPMSAFDQPWLR